MIEQANAVVALGGDFFSDGTIGPASIQRMDVAIGLINTEVAIHLIVSGAYPFISRKHPNGTYADVMKEYAISEGVPENLINVEDKSLDTIGNALFTRKMFTEPNDWKKLIIVTNESHLQRSQRIFDHVMGATYDIKTASAGENPVRFHHVHETLGDLLMKMVLNHVEPGDTDVIQERLFGIIPGYANVPVARRLLNLSDALLAK